MKYRIVDADKMYVVGVKAQANFMTNGQITGQLARQFMPRLREITNRKNDYSLSLQKYKNFNFNDFTPQTNFEKWIGVEVEDLESIPEGMLSLVINPGNYLVFDFKGSIQDFIAFWQELHSNLLPNSVFTLDNRPHFERLPKSYSPMNSENEEEIWVPI